MEREPPVGGSPPFHGESDMREMHFIAEPGKPELAIRREFDAPRKQAFRAFIDPGLYVRWIGPGRLTTRLETFEPRRGGSYRYIQTDTDGSEYAFHGVYHEVTVPAAIISTFEFEGLPEGGHVVLDVTHVEDLPGDRTRVTSRSVFLSVEDRDGMVQSGMEAGMNQSYERLDEVLSELTQGASG